MTDEWLLDRLEMDAWYTLSHRLLIRGQAAVVNELIIAETRGVERMCAEQRRSEDIKLVNINMLRQRGWVTLDVGTEEDNNLTP